MSKNKYKKMLIICLILVFVIIAVETAVMSGNMIHMNHCHIDNCSICTLIQLSTTFIRNIGLVDINILLLVAIVPLMQLINKNIRQIVRATLVELKVVQNN